jgi:large subunit ribosomal protein L35
MPKLKTNKSAKKRFKVSKNGKVKRARPGKRHLLSSKTAKRRRQLRRVAGCSPYDSFRIKRLLGKG